KLIGPEDLQQQKITRTGTIIGTPYYMAPEQLSLGAIDGRADVYSLGLVFYEMITGETPFSDKAFAQLVTSRLSGEIPSLAVVASRGARGAVCAVLRRALSLRPEGRYPGVAEFYADMRAAAQGQPVSKEAQALWSFSLPEVAAAPAPGMEAV